VLYHVVESSDGSISTASSAASLPDLERVSEWRALNPAFATSYYGRLPGPSRQPERCSPQRPSRTCAAWKMTPCDDGRRPTPYAVLFVTCGHWDLGTALPLELRNKLRLRLPSLVYSRWRNLKDEFAAAYGVRPCHTPPLPPLPLTHSGLDDSRNISCLLEDVWTTGYRVYEVRSATAPSAGLSLDVHNEASMALSLAPPASQSQLEAATSERAQNIVTGTANGIGRI
jgi:hypothetical protein